jgi:hypothetical protein
VTTNKYDYKVDPMKIPQDITNYIASQNWVDTNTSKGVKIIWDVTTHPRWKKCI